MKNNQMPEKRWDHAFSTLLKHEGGFVNDKDDPGGETKYGVSLRFLKASGEDINLDGKIDITDIMAISRRNAKGIYKRYWWDKYKYNLIDDLNIATKIFDLSVNMGAAQAHKLAQRAVNTLISPPIIVDGILGAKTLKAINDLCNAHQETLLLDDIKKHARAFYISLVRTNPTLEKYLKGWLSRADD